MMAMNECTVFEEIGRYDDDDDDDNDDDNDLVFILGDGDMAGENGGGGDP